MGKAYNKYYSQEPLMQGQPVPVQSNVPIGNTGPQPQVEPVIPEHSTQEPIEQQKPQTRNTTKKEPIKRQLIVFGCKQLYVRKEANQQSEVVDRVNVNALLDTNFTPVELAKLKEEMFVPVTTSNNTKGFVMRKYVKLSSKE